MGEPSPRPVILMVDDDEDDRLIIGEALKECCPEYPVVPLGGGEELLEYLERQGKGSTPGLILLDLNMYRMRGEEVLSQLRGRAEWRDLPVVVLTTSSDERDRQHCEDLGADGFLTKPSSYHKFVELLRPVTARWLVSPRPGPPAPEAGEAHP